MSTLYFRLICCWRGHNFMKWRRHDFHCRVCGLSITYNRSTPHGGRSDQTSKEE